jgi:dUTPase
LPTGVHFNVPEDNMLMVLEKTSIPNKTGIISGARVIDAGYTGEFIASLINTSSIPEFL